MMTFTGGGLVTWIFTIGDCLRMEEKNLLQGKERHLPDTATMRVDHALLGET